LINDDQKARVDEAGATVKLREAELNPAAERRQTGRTAPGAARLDELRAA